jgi:hypothetical protein
LLTFPVSTKAERIRVEGCPVGLGEGQAIGAGVALLKTMTRGHCFRISSAPTPQTRLKIKMESLLLRFMLLN